ncbi:MAG: amidohydrolase family protein [Candidatus Asgardarchaeia archaeon]
MKVIDVHIHPIFKELVEEKPALLDFQRDVFGLHTSPQPIQALISQMEEKDVELGVLLPIDCTTRWGKEFPSNEDVAKIVEKYPDNFIGFASVDPRDPDSVEKLEFAVKKLGLRGVKLHPSLQGFDPSSDSTERVLAKAEELEIPVLVHTGIVWQKKHPIRYCNPLIWDELASKHENLNIIMAHFGWPWVWDAVSVALRNRNVYLDTSDTFTGTPKEHFDEILKRRVPERIPKRFLGERILFGSNSPRIELLHMVEGISELDMDEMLKRDILYTNSKRLLNL